MSFVILQRLTEREENPNVLSPVSREHLSFVLWSRVTNCFKQGKLHFLGQLYWLKSSYQKRLKVGSQDTADYLRIALSVQFMKQALRPEGVPILKVHVGTKRSAKSLVALICLVVKCICGVLGLHLFIFLNELLLVLCSFNTLAKS